jgi:hypothetical protein
VLVAIDASRGCVATTETPEEDVRYIRFRPGSEPTQLCVYEPIAAPIPSVTPSPG